MLAKKYRLPLKPGERMSGKRRANDFFVVVKRPNMLAYRRFGFVVSKKLYKLAVDRNKLKRRLRAIARELVEEGSGDYLVIARSPVKTLDFGEIKERLVELVAD